MAIIFTAPIQTEPSASAIILRPTDLPATRKSATLFTCRLLCITTEVIKTSREATIAQSSICIVVNVYESFADSREEADHEGIRMHFLCVFSFVRN
ncbi:MAG: hypothetical protein HOC71_19575 [Candidatus Latescibacteria bacterium]|nr:hypothetical protein [Candidatus Latescibacterota bacterium]